MESYKAYQVARAGVIESDKWLANTDKIDSQDHKPYQLTRVVVLAEYCGQSHAGAPNYHKSPDVLNEALAAVIKSRFTEITEAAMQLLRDKERSALIACDADIQRMQKEIDSAKDAAQ